MSHRHDVVAADEDMGLAVSAFGRPQELRGTEHHEQRLLVDFELRPLVGVNGVFDGQIVKAELFAARAASPAPSGPQSPSHTN